MKFFSATDNLPAWTERLPAERRRIVRLCARLSGSYDAAEDLAQETLYEVWRQARSLRDPTAWRGFVTGIARNVCSRYRQAHARDAAHRAGDGVLGEELERAVDPFDLDLTLEADERADLVGRALGALPGNARDLLIERYLDDLPQAEIAARRHLTENAVGVRIHRARAALRRVVEESPELAEDAVAHGLIVRDDDADGWQPTRIYCPCCGQHALEARFERAPHGEDSFCRPRFGVRCPGCAQGLGFDFTTGHSSLDSQSLVGDLTAYKPALSRVNQWWEQYYRAASVMCSADCPICGRPARVTMTPPANAPRLVRSVGGMYLCCERPEHVCCVSAAGIAFHQPESRAFWRRHPRMALTDQRDIVFAGRPAVSVTMQSVTDAARLEVILDRASFLPLHVA
jgi:RNA polymerase sigma factor (sigma-70 family)